MEITKKNTASQESNILGEFVFKFVPYWPLFVLLMLVAFGASWAYLKVTPSTYQATARILINDEKKGTEDSKTVELLDRLSTKKTVENEMEIIQSKTLLNEVAINLHLYANIFEEKGMKKIIRYKTSPVFIEVKDPESIVSTKKQAFQFDGKNVIIKGVVYPLNTWVRSAVGMLKFIPNEKGYSAKSEQLYFEMSPPKAVAGNIGKGLNVAAASKLSSILTLTQVDQDPERAEDILNELLAAYNRAIVHDKSLLATNTLQFIDDRLSAVQHELDSIERNIQRFRASKGAIDISTQGKIYLQSVSANDQTLTDININMAVLNQVESYVYSKDKTGGIIPSTLGVKDPALSGLVEKLYSSELDYEGMKNSTGENNPMTLSVKDKIEKLKGNILDNIRNQKGSLQASRDNISATNNNYSSTLRALPEQERELININREQGIKNEVYNFLLQRREEAALSSASSNTDSKIVDQAEASWDPVSPRKKIVYVIASLFALFAGIIIVLIKENFNSKVLFRHEIESLTSYPIIGEISAENKKGPIVIAHGKRTFIAEQFRKLRASLSYTSINAGNKKILVTSSIAGEGKSFVAVNLAISLALTGKKVVLIDFDLNNPSLSRKLKMSRSTGINEYLEGMATLSEIIGETDIDKNLNFIATGELPPNPAELIMNGKVGTMLDELSKRFDYIVIDSAPVSPVTDASLLSPYCDVTLYVIKHGYTPKVFVQRIDETIRINPLKNVSIIFNGVTSRGFGNKNYGYGYGYGYITREGSGRRSKWLPAFTRGDESIKQ